MKKRSRVVRFEMPSEPSGGVIEKKPKEDRGEPSDGDSDASGSSSSSEEAVSAAQPGLDFAAAFASILAAEIKAEPVLAQNNGFAGELKKRKIEVAVERQVAEARRQVREQWKKTPDPHEDIEEQRRLKKVATSGVVKLFNAINQQQRASRDTALPASTKMARDYQQLTKESFLGALKTAPAASKGRQQPASGAAWLQADFEADEEEQRDYAKAETIVFPQDEDSEE